MDERTDINVFALQQAELAAARLWAYGSSSFPLVNGAVIQRHVEREVTDTAIAYAIHVRRILDNYGIRNAFELSEPFRHWSPVGDVPRVRILRDALNRIVHATEFTVGFERLPDASSNISGGAIGVVYLRTRTDQRDAALIDVFALASCFFHQILPNVRQPVEPTKVPAI